MFCKHDLELIDFKIIPSEVERIHLLGLTPKTWNDLKETYIWIFKCKKCPKVKKVVQIV